MKANSNNKPNILQDLGNGSWHYNYNIKELKLELEDEQSLVSNSYNYEYVLIWGTPTYEKCVKAVLRDRICETEEFSLINKYNSFILGISGNKTDKIEYENYLKEIIKIKAMVKYDLKLIKEECRTPLIDKESV